MKIFSIILFLLMLTGCFANTSATVKATSSEADLINTLADSGCSIDKYHRVARLGTVDVKCK